LGPLVEPELWASDVNRRDRHGQLDICLRDSDRHRLTVAFALDLNAIELAASAAAQITRTTGKSVAYRLAAQPRAPGLGHLDAADQGRSFAESLPSGLKLL
jgi:hypothetical protein